jgi:HPt (histidine-containing phosphotransfer) domain-containing protein
LRRLAQAAARAGAGTAFLIARQRQGAAVTARAASLAAAAATIEQHLREAGFEIVAEPARADLPHWTVLERGDPDRRSLLRVRLEKLAAELAPSGLSLRLTGPWPAYRAARAATEETVNG